MKQEFYKPMKNNGLLTCEQLDVIFQNLEELIDVNKQFTDRLQQAVDAAINAGDEVTNHYVLHYTITPTSHHSINVVSISLQVFLFEKEMINFGFI